MVLLLWHIKYNSIRIAAYEERLSLKNVKELLLQTNVNA